MSQYAKKSIPDSGNDPLSTRFRDSLSSSSSATPKMKPADFSRELDLGSPVSPLPTRNLATSAAPATTTSSGSTSGSSGSVSGKVGNSGELTSEVSTARLDSSRSGPNGPASHLGHRRSSSAGAPLIYSGSSFTSATSNGATSAATAGSPGLNSLPSGNICPSGKILKKIGLPSRASNRNDTLMGKGAGNYGHGSIMRGGGGAGGGKLGIGCGGAGGGCDPEEMKREGNEMYRRGKFVEALALYDKAILLSPDNAAYRSNRAAAFTALGRLSEAVKECEEAVRLDPGYARAHQRLASLYLRVGQAEEARSHLNVPRQQPDPLELHRLQLLEKHMNRCVLARKVGDWNGVIRETDGALAIGIDSSPQLIACRAEAFSKLYQHEDADSTISKIPKFEHYSSQTKFFGMLSEAYILYVRAQVEMALGRFDNAVSLAEKAVLIDHGNIELSMVLNNMKAVARARTHGNDLFSSGRYAEASSAYGEGLKYDTSSVVLYCNRAVCWSKLGLWEKSVEECNKVLKIQPNYTKALLRRAASNGKLGRWAEAVKDYVVLRQELPNDNEVVEHLRQAENALKKYHGQVYDGKLGGEVEEVCRLDKFKAAISSPGVAVVHFKAEGDDEPDDMSPFMNMLCVRYPSIHFFKVDVGETLAIAKAESIRTVPTFKVYKNGDMVKEIIRPSHQLLEDSVRSYSL